MLMSKVLVVDHSISGNNRQMAEVVAEGARSASGTEAEVKEGLQATTDDLLECDGVALGFPDYFSASLSMACWATIRFSRLFSPSNSLSRRSSEISIFPNCLRHR